MTKPIDPREEARLRELIRKELEQREQIRSDESEALRERHESGGLTDDRRRIIEDEIRKFHEQRGNAREYENEDGDVEWLTEDEIIEREKQIPVDMEELEVGQRSIRNRVVLISFLLFFGLVLLFVALRDKSGSVQVICNVPQATIFLNGSPTEFETDHALHGLPSGYHLITVAKGGYRPDGPRSARVKIGPGSEQIVILKLKPENSRSALE